MQLNSVVKTSYPLGTQLFTGINKIQLIILINFNFKKVYYQRIFNKNKCDNISCYIVKQINYMNYYDEMLGFAALIASVN